MPRIKITGCKAACIFSNPTEASNAMETEASDWSKQEFDEPPPFSDIVDANFNGEYFQIIKDFKKLNADYEYLIINSQKDLL